MSGQSAASSPYLPNLLRNGKYIVFGLLGVRHWGVGDSLRRALLESNAGGLGIRALQLSFLFSAVTVSLFLYLVVYLPRIKGVVPNYSRWQASSSLSTVVPLLTVSIISGFVLLIVGLTNERSGRGETGGRLVSAIGGALSIYATTFGVIGLIPSPKPVRSPRVD
ncbi:hypothetical protein [Phaffia rhodozyma]|uniref:Uncharacterized protein n=1 Tax=Phaffia rhodozyma TaxID=264483 RepID=A0A0F7SL24_PHARH|nr:hypothetical protein [Phaffia rhodozyma]